jgi:hypothetical protein
MDNFLQYKTKAFELNDMRIIEAQNGTIYVKNQILTENPSSLEGKSQICLVF